VENAVGLDTEWIKSPVLGERKDSLFPTVRYLTLRSVSVLVNDNWLNVQYVFTFALVVLHAIGHVNSHRPRRGNQGELY
jgi:hypothetical protein